MAWLNSCILTSVSDSLQSRRGEDSLESAVTKYSQQFLRAAELLRELLPLKAEEEGGGGGGVEGDEAGLCPLLADGSPRGDDLPGRGCQPGRELTALLQPHSLLEDELPHPVVRSQSQAEPVTPGAEPLRHVDVETVRGEGQAAVLGVRVPVLPGLPVLPDPAHRHQEDVAARLPGAQALEALGEGGPVVQSSSRAFA